jgi:hypothetical protein
MSLAHILYIPAILLLGIVIGYVLAGRAAAAARADKDADERRREARRARQGEARDDPPRAS